MTKAAGRRPSDESGFTSRPFSEMVRLLKGSTLRSDSLTGGPGLPRLQSRSWPGACGVAAGIYLAVQVRVLAGAVYKNGEPSVEREGMYKAKV